MAKKAVRKQAPPKPGERPQPSEAPATGGEDERSIEDLVADLGTAEEPAPEPPKRKPRRKGKRGSAEEGEVEVDASTDAPAAAEPAADDADPSEARDPTRPEPTTSELLAALAAAEVDPDADADSPEPGAEAGDEPSADASDEPSPEPAADAPPEDPRAVRLVDSLPIDVEDDLSQVEGEASPRLVSIVESLLFASSKPLRVKQIRRLLEEPSVRQIQLALKHLIANNDARGIVVAQVAGGFVLQTHPQNATWVQRLLQAKPIRLSRPQLETLAVIAYRQPVTRAEIDHVRGVDSGAVMKMLLERELIQIVGKTEQPGRPMAFGTTVGFLEFFNLMSLRDLPDLREFRELSDDTKATLRKRMGDSEAEALGQEVLQFAGVDEPGAASPAEGEPSEGQEVAAAGESPDDEPVFNRDRMDDDAIAGLIAAAERDQGDTPEDDTPEDETPEDDTPEDDTPEDETPEDDTPEDDTPEDETPEDETPEDETPEDDTPEDDTPEDDTPEDDTPEEPNEPDDEAAGPDDEAAGPDDEAAEPDDEAAEPDDEVEPDQQAEADEPESSADANDPPESADDPAEDEPEPT